MKAACLTVKFHRSDRYISAVNSILARIQFIAYCSANANRNNTFLKVTLFLKRSVLPFSFFFFFIYWPLLLYASLFKADTDKCKTISCSVKMSWTGQYCLCLCFNLQELSCGKPPRVSVLQSPRHHITGRESHCVTMFTLSQEQGISLHLSPYRTKQIKIKC